MHESDESPTVALRRLIGGYRVSQALYALVALGVPDLLHEEPRTAADLAPSVSAHPDALLRLLRTLAVHGVLREDAQGRFALTAVGEGLRPGAQGGLSGLAGYLGRPHHWDAWGALLHSVRTGETAFEHLHGTDVWTYRAQHPEEGEAFQRFMTHNTEGLHAALLGAYDFSGFRQVVDVGGGEGVLLAALLRAHPHLRGVLFDQPQVAAVAEARLRGEGLAECCAVVGGSFFDGVPAGGDAYLLKLVLHDWEDERAALILRRVREAMPPDATLLVIERVLDDANLDGALSDLNMLVVTGGRERRLEAYGALLTGAGFSAPRAVPTRAGVQLLEARPS